MNDNVTATLIAAALLLTGTLAGIGLSSVADGATTVTVAATPPVVTVTAPPVTVRVTIRANRSHSRGAVPQPSASNNAEGNRAGVPGGASRVSVRQTPGVPSAAEIADYQAYARARVPADQWPCLKALWTRESNWNPQAVNGSHFGIPQMRGLKHSTGWKRQIERGLGYIAHRYDGPCDALHHSDLRNWY